MADLSEILGKVTSSGDRSAWEELVRAQAGRLHSIAWAVTRDSALAEDVVQETFLRIAQGRLPRIRRGAGEAFLARMAARVAIDLVRRRESRTKREEEYAMARERSLEGPAEQMLSAELHGQLGEGFARLPSETRAAMWLHLVEGEGLREVAACLGCSRTTAFQRVRDGAARLREFLRKRGFALPAAAPWQAMLRSLPPPAVSAGLVERLVGLGTSLVPRAAASAGLSGALTGAFIMSGKKVTLSVGLGLLLILGAGLAIVDPLGLREPDRRQAGSPEVPRPVGALARGPERGTKAGEPAAISEAAVTSPPPVTEARIAFRGVVLDALTAEPIESARVRHGEKEAATDGDGRFELELAMPASESSRSFGFTVTASGYARASYDSRAGPLALPGEELVQLMPVPEIRGWVLDMADEPIEGAVINIGGLAHGETITYHSPPAEGHARTAKDGSFVLTPYLFGQPRLTVFKPGYGGAVFLNVEAGAREVVLRLPPGARVTGRLRAGGGVAVAGQKVLWFTEDPDHAYWWRGEAAVGPDGSFEIAGLPAPGAHVIYPGELSPEDVRRAMKEGRADLARKVHVEVDEAVGEVQFDLAALAGWRAENDRVAKAAGSTPRAEGKETPRRRVRVHGTVRDTAGRPIAGAFVVASLRLDHFVESLQALSGPMGRFECQKDLKAGPQELRLVVNHPSWSTERLDLGEALVPEGESGEPAETAFGSFEVTMVKGYDVRGVACDRLGRALPGAQVLVFEKSDPRYFGTTGDDGGFLVKHRSPQIPLKVVLHHQDSAPLVVAPKEPLAEGQTLDLGRLHLTPGGGVRGVVRRADGSPLRNRYVALEKMTLKPPAPTDAEGRFHLEHVPPGTYRLRVLKTTRNHLWPDTYELEDPSPVQVIEDLTIDVELKIRG